MPVAEQLGRGGLAGGRCFFRGRCGCQLQKNSAIGGPVEGQIQAVLNALDLPFHPQSAAGLGGESARPVLEQGGQGLVKPAFGAAPQLGTYIGGNMGGAQIRPQGYQGAVGLNGA